MQKKRLFALILALLTLVFLISCGEKDPSEAPRKRSGKTVTLNVYNWGQYISDGAEDTLDVNALFEEYFEENFASEYGFSVEVNYTTFASNEDMYNKLRSGATSYDVIVPSDYMIQRLIGEGLLCELDYDNMPNVKNIDPAYRDLFYDPDNKYSVPYMFGMVGIIYNQNMVDEADTGSWDLMWNEKYKGKILQFNNPRDAFGTAMYYKGISVNTTDKDEWRVAQGMLQEQKPLVQSYVMDEIFNKMKNGSAAIAAYYAGDYLTMYEGNDALGFYYPEEGTNVYVDAFCIPTCAQNKEIAELYIDFMCTEEPAVANAEYTYYGSPNLLVRENEEYKEVMAEVHPDVQSIMYPPTEDVERATYYYTLSDEMLAHQNNLWSELKIESTMELWIPITAAVIVGSLILWLGLGIIRNKIRESKY